MKDPLEIEWRRLLRHVRRHGPSQTAKHVSELLRQGNYPTYYPYKLSEYLLKRGEFQAAGKLLKQTRRFGAPHPLIDKLYGKWLWANGERKSAIRYMQVKAAHWSKSSLFSLLSSMYLVLGKKVLAQKNFDKAATLAAQELAAANIQRDQVSAGTQNRPGRGT